VVNLRKLVAGLLAGIGSAAAGFFTVFLPFGVLLVLAAVFGNNKKKLQVYKSAKYCY